MNPMSVADLSVDELKALMREAFEEAMRAPMPDDEGELRPEFEEALAQSLASGKPTLSTDELRRRLGLPAA